MIGFVSIFTGIIIVFITVLLIRREFERTVHKHPLSRVTISDENAKEIMAQLMTIEETVEQMNGSFYNIVGDLEGKYSVHDKELELLQESMNQIKVALKDKALSEIECKSSKSPTEFIEDLKDKSYETVPEVYGDGLSTNDIIKRLRSDGLSVSQIAKQLDMGVGEVVLHIKKMDSM